MPFITRRRLLEVGVVRVQPPPRKGKRGRKPIPDVRKIHNWIVDAKSAENLSYLREVLGLADDSSTIRQALIIAKEHLNAQHLQIERLRNANETNHAATPDSRRRTGTQNTNGTDN